MIGGTGVVGYDWCDRSGRCDNLLFSCCSQVDQFSLCKWQRCDLLRLSSVILWLKGSVATRICIMSPQTLPQLH